MRTSLSNPALAAKAIKSELKAAFPTVKFSVSSKGSAVRVEWTEGPTTKQVEEFTGKYQQGHFDGMTDMYEYSNSRSDIPQANYVFTTRNKAEGTYEALVASAEKMGIESREVNRIFYAHAVPVGAKIIGIKSIGTCGLLEEVYGLAIEGESVEAKVEEVQPVAPAAAGEVQIVDYSEKAFAVIGDTKPVKEVLKAAGGKFNPHLKCGAGWIFSKKRMQEVTAALQAA